MPDLDFMVVCDHVRAEGGLLHMLAAGLDKIIAAQVPTAHSFGVGVRLTLTRAECDTEHELHLIFQGADGERIMEMVARLKAEYPRDVPIGWPAKAVAALNVAIVLPRFGEYSLELLVNGSHMKAIPITVVPLTQLAIET